MNILKQIEGVDTIQITLELWNIIKNIFIGLIIILLVSLPIYMLGYCMSLMSKNTLLYFCMTVFLTSLSWVVGSGIKQKR